VDDDTLARLRREYSAHGLSEVEAGDEPYALLRRWLADAIGSGLNEPNAMVLATVDATGMPSARTVLLKGMDTVGLRFFSNYESRKAAGLATGLASLLLPWHPLQRQVRLEGRVTRLSRAENEAYFALRPRGAQLSAWASPQSQPVPDRDWLEHAYAQTEQRFAGTDPVPCPPHWGGYRLTPDMVEFWQGRGNRLHDRLRFDRHGEEWRRSRLAP